MRLLGSLVVVALASAPAVAQPDDCAVDFVRVPDEVRHEIERWLAKETHCTTSIALRVIPTDQGTLYLVGQRLDGHIHEREVPDAAAAGVLVASWVADDWTSAPAVVVGVPVAGAPVVGGAVVDGAVVGGAVVGGAVRAPAVGAVVSAAPVVSAVPVGSAAPVVGAPSVAPAGSPVDAVVETPGRRAGRWISVTPMLHPGGGGGIRADVDLLGGTRWTFGAGAAYLSTSDSDDNRMTSMEATRVMLYAARAFDLSGGFQLRGSFALGKVWATGSSVYAEDGWRVNGDATAVQSEMAVLVAHDVTGRLSVLGGPVVTAGLMKLDGEDDSFFDQFDLMLMAGARFRL